MAQDFYAAFRIGEDDRHVTSIDEDGVALAAIKALNQENARLRGQISELRARDDARLTALERCVTALAREPFSSEVSEPLSDTSAHQLSDVPVIRRAIVK